MSDKLSRKIVEEYANLRKDYAKLVMGITVSADKYEQEILSALSVNEMTIDDVKEDMDSLQKHIEKIKAKPEPEVKKKKLKK